MEAFERGVIRPADSDGLHLEWGNSEVMIELVRAIGERRGLGALLGQGVRRASTKLGSKTESFSIHVKDLELPGHDPRAYYGQALSYATSNRGACHTAGWTNGFENTITMPEIGLREAPGRLTDEGKAALVVKAQDLMTLFDSLKLCKMLTYGGVVPSQIVDWLNQITGWDFDIPELMLAGERIFNLKRLYNLRCGVTAADDTLPRRILMEPRNGRTPPLEHMLEEYYALRGWDHAGVPTSAKLSELDLE